MLVSGEGQRSVDKKKKKNTVDGGGASTREMFAQFYDDYIWRMNTKVYKCIFVFMDFIGYKVKCWKMELVGQLGKFKGLHSHSDTWMAS